MASSCLLLSATENRRSHEYTSADANLNHLRIGVISTQFQR
uniref:MltR family transcriptional regulator n=1 Tax=Ascaris lumbricoides TaxID=6252 RepID=A0A0M3I817_ASCLU